MTLRPCPTPGCPSLTNGGRCTSCSSTADKARGTAAQRGYTSKGHARFRRLVLKRDPICVVCDLVPSTVADHHPLSRRELVDAGRDPNDPSAGRGLCARCHSRETAKHQPGGFLAH